MTKGFHASHTGGLRLVRALQKARAVLGVSVAPTREEVKKAFSLMVKYHHPDSTQDPMQSELDGNIMSASYTLQVMRDAKDLLLKNLEDGND